MPLIYDVGAHEGEDTGFYLKKGFQVVAVEANPVLADKLRDKFADAIASGQLTVVAAAIAEKEGEIAFFVNERSVWGTTSESWAKRNAQMGQPSEKVMVPAVNFSSILEKFGVPHYLKVDIEGADMLCIRALAQMSKRPRFISLESCKTSWRELVTEIETLSRLGFNRFKVVNQNDVEQQCEPQPALEGEFTGHRFPAGSSGLFGQDLPGRWLSRRQALLRYAFIYSQYTLFGDNTTGARLAKRLPYRVHRHLLPGWYDTHAMQGS
jgi:FkbM family methyltransferase